jgi:hypothetical protein
MTRAAAPAARASFIHGFGFRTSGRCWNDITPSSRVAPAPASGPALNTTPEALAIVGKLDPEHPRVVRIVGVQAQAASHRRDRGERSQQQVAAVNGDLGAGTHERSEPGW